MLKLKVEEGHVLLVDERLRLERRVHRNRVRPRARLQVPRLMRPYGDAILSDGCELAEDVVVQPDAVHHDFSKLPVFFFFAAEEVRVVVHRVIPC